MNTRISINGEIGFQIYCKKDASRISRECLVNIKSTLLAVDLQNSKREQIRMAEAVVSFVVERLGDLLIQKAVFLKGVRSQVERLLEELKRMQCFLKDADARQEEDERVRNWVSEIRNTAYDAEDIVDIFIRNAETKHSIFKKWMDLNKIGKEIEAIQIRIQDISKSRVTYGITNIGEATNSASQMLMKLRQSSPRIDDQGIVGFQNDTNLLVERLLRKDQRRTVVSIVGMGGIGKTTLAKKVYNDRRVVDHFQYCRAWVYVSLDCKPRDIFQRIINQISLSSECEAERTEKLQEDELRDFLHDFLKEKRYLVVLDDLWKSEDWKYVANAFPRESNGSRLLLTTRNKDVALHADPLSVPHTIQLLSANESWRLFCRTAFPGDDPESCPLELRELGEKMVGKCAGLPLAIVVLGGLLSRKKKSPTDWAKVLNNIGVHLSGGKDGVDAMLNLSFIDLPPYLKSCFLYFSLFPDDHVISVRKICRLWVAEGFIPQQDGRRMEDMAEDYLNELIDRNLVQMVRMSTNERVRECRIHDLARDFSIKKAKEESFAEIQQSIASVHSTSSSTNSRRHGIFSDFERYASNKHSTPHLRSLLFFKLDDKSCQVSQLDFVYKCFKLLRVIDLDGVEIGRMTSSFGKLIHLRYLGLSHTGLETLPTSIGNLTSLQTLDVRCVKNVPNVIWKMENLRHLLVDGRTDDMPLQIDTLRNLQTLSGIRFNEWGDNDLSKLTTLQKLKIRGKFELEWVKFSDSIAKLENLQSLSLVIQSLPSNRFTSEEQSPFLAMNSWLHLYKMVMNGPIVQLPAAHEFPPSLTQLTLQGSGLGRDPMPILGNLPKLSTLRLRTGSYHGTAMQVSSFGFLQLKKLQISDLDRLKWIYVEKGGMPRLAQFQVIEVDCSIYGLNHLSHLHEVDVSINASSRFPLIDGLEVFPGLPNWARSLMSSSDWHHTWRHTGENKGVIHFYRK